MQYAVSGVAGGNGGGPPGRQNRTSGVVGMVRKKVFKGTVNFWVRRKIFRVMGETFRVGRI